MESALRERNTGAVGEQRRASERGGWVPGCFRKRKWQARYQGMELHHEFWGTKLLRAGPEPSERYGHMEGLVHSSREIEPNLKARRTFDEFLAKVCVRGWGVDSNVIALQGEELMGSKQHWRLGGQLGSYLSSRQEWGCSKTKSPGKGTGEWNWGKLRNQLLYSLGSCIEGCLRCWLWCLGNWSTIHKAVKPEGGSGSGGIGKYAFIIDILSPVLTKFWWLDVMVQWGLSVDKES